MAQYVIREHDRGRSLHDILEDKYVVNRLESPEQRARLLDRPEIIHAVGGDMVEAAKASLAPRPHAHGTSAGSGISLRSRTARDRGNGSAICRTQRNGPRGRAVSGMKLGGGWDDSYHRPAAPAGPSPDRVILRDGLRTRSAAPGTGLPRCGSRPLPEARLVVGPQLDPPEPLRALPEVLARARPAAAASRARQSAARRRRGSRASRPHARGTRPARSTLKPASACAIANRAVGRCPTSSRDGRPGDPGERRVEPAPARDAVDVLRHLDARKLVQLLPRQRHRGVDLAGDAEVPAGEIGRIRRDRAGVEDRPFLGQVLAGRAAGPGRSPPRAPSSRPCP